MRTNFPWALHEVRSTARFPLADCRAPITTTIVRDRRAPRLQFFTDFELIRRKIHTWKTKLQALLTRIPRQPNKMSKANAHLRAQLRATRTATGGRTN